MADRHAVAPRENERQEQEQFSVVPRTELCEAKV